MGISYTTEDSHGDNIRRVVHLEGEFDASYTSGGEPLTPGDASLGSLEFATVTSGATTGGYVPAYDSENGTIMLFYGGGADAAMTEVPGGTDVSGETVRLRLIGRS